MEGTERRDRAEAREAVWERAVVVIPETRTRGVNEVPLVRGGGGGGGVLMSGQ